MANNSQKKILVVEDEHLLADMYREKISKQNWKVFLASSSKEGLEVAKKEKPDLVLLDILLVDSHGLDFLRERKKDKELNKIPVLIFSNLEDPETEKEALSLGAKEYLLKTSYTPSALMEKLERYIKE